MSRSLPFESVLSEGLIWEESPAQPSAAVPVARPSAGLTPQPQSSAPAAEQPVSRETPAVPPPPRAVAVVPPRIQPEPVVSGGPAIASASPLSADEEESPIDEDALPEEETSPVHERVFQRRRRGSPKRGRRLVSPEEVANEKASLTGPQRLLILDSWLRSGLPAGDFAPLVGLSKHTLYLWKRQFAEQGPAGLADHPRGGPKGSRLPDLTKRAILMLKESHPEWGCQRISDPGAPGLRGPALPASPSAVARVLHEACYELVENPTRPHPDKVRSFERARPNQLWQTDLFTFVVKRQNRRVYLVAFQDDHSRFIVSYGLYASQSTALVLEVLRAGIDTHGSPQEILTDNGAQYVTWRGKSAFTKELEKRGIRQIVAKPRRPQTLGKIERFWGTLWREFLETAVFADLDDARRRIGLFLDYYNFQRSHSSLEGLVPADRFFGVGAEVLKTLKARVAANALELARQGAPKTPFYVTGQVGGQSFSVHAEGERMILTREGSVRQEVALTAPVEQAPPAAAGRDAATTGSAPVPVGAGPSQLPMPLCPNGVPPAGIAEERC